MWEAGSRSASIHTFLEAPAPAVRTACTTARPRLWQWVGASTKINLFQAGAGGHDAAMSRITPAGLALPTVRGPPGSSWMTTTATTADMLAGVLACGLWKSDLVWCQCSAGASIG